MGAKATGFNTAMGYQSGDNQLFDSQGFQLGIEIGFFEGVSMMLLNDVICFQGLQPGVKLPAWRALNQDFITGVLDKKTGTWALWA